MSIYRDLVKRRPIADLTRRGLREFDELLDRIQPAMDAPTEVERRALIDQEFGSREAARAFFEALPPIDRSAQFDERHLSITRDELLAAVPVDLTGVLPEDEQELGAIEPRAFPWEFTWLEDFDLGLGMLVTTHREPCPCCEQGLWTVALELFFRGQSRQTCFLGREELEFDATGASKVRAGEVATENCLRMCYGIQSYVAKLIGCKNVEVVASRPASSKASQKKKRDKRGRGIEWKVVSITSKGKRRYRLGRTPKRDRGPARHHVVAGHFKTYTAEAPLLGRAVGTFFWGQFARGSRRAGEIRKVYADRLDTPLLTDAIEAHHQGGSDVLNRQRGGGREANREPASPDVIGRPAAVVE